MRAHTGSHNSQSSCLDNEAESVPAFSVDKHTWTLQPKVLRGLNVRFGPFEDIAPSDSTGKSVLCCPTLENAGRTLLDYLYCFDKQPNTARALFVLPDRPHHEWWNYFWIDPCFRLVSYYPTGSDIFVPTGEASGITECLVMILLHSKVAPSIPTPKSGFWPPVTPPAEPVL